MEKLSVEIENPRRAVTCPVLLPLPGQVVVVHASWENRGLIRIASSKKATRSIYAIQIPPGMTVEFSMPRFAVYAKGSVPGDRVTMRVVRRSW